MTGLPIIETKANDISAYIPTNVISITDGQCYFDPDLFNAGQRPAIDVGNSVSRVSGAQVKAMKSVAGTLRIDLAQYRDLEAFASFGSDLDAASKAQLARGERMTELLKQGQYSPVPVQRQIVALWAGTSGQLDDVPVEDVLRFEDEFLDYVGHQQEQVYGSITESGALDDDTTATLEQAITTFKRGFATSDGTVLGDEQTEAMDATEVGKEKVTRYVPKPEQ
jgi:F-type H+-transporting ATPase subunit alpha